MGEQNCQDGDGAAIVAELARRFQAGDGAGALRLFHPAIRIDVRDLPKPVHLRRPASEAPCRW